MQFYRLHYVGDDASSEMLPVTLNQSTPQDQLDEYAQQFGDNKFDWSHVKLKDANDVLDPLNELNWDLFKNALVEEDSLFDYPWNVFERRIKSGHLSAVIDENNNVVATVNILPKLNGNLRSVLGINNNPKLQDNFPQVYETGAGWTDKSYRGVGVYTQLRTALMEETKATGKLVFSQGKGKGAANVNIKGGWALVNWDEFPFAAALMGWLEQKSLKNQFRLAAGKVIDLPENGLYKEKTQRSDTKVGQAFIKAHDWTKNHHLWVNDLSKLKRFEKNLTKALAVNNPKSFDVVEHSLSVWKDRIADSLFYDRDLLGNDDKIAQAWKEFTDTYDELVN